jgi:CDP-glucose 4,6-dehydratase
MEPLFGYMSVALKMDMTADGHSRFGSAWNFGPSVDDNYPVKYLVQDAIQAWGSGEVQYNIDPSAPHEARLLKLDISKVTNELGWRPRMNAKTAVERTIQWYKNFYKGASAAELLNTDLSFYQSLFI